MIELGPLKRTDLQACMALSSAAGWNQTEEDWRTILTTGLCLAIRRDSVVVASAALMSYACMLGWIGMVLVDQSERRRGHASALLDVLIAEAGHQNLIVGLDATPEGRLVYQRLGFTDIYTLTRFASRAAPPPAKLLAPYVRPIEADALPQVLAYDLPVFGVDRGALLVALQSRAPALAHCAFDKGRLSGFVMARKGRVATQIGPLVADHEDIARALLSAALGKIDGPVLIDVPDRHADWSRVLQQAGFVPQRSFTRMLRNRAVAVDRPESLFAVTGPEFA